MMTLRLVGGSVVATIVALAGVSAQTAPPPSSVQAGRPTECAALTGLRLDGGTTITEAALVSGNLTISPTVTVKDMPAFCRVQAVSTPTSDSNIFFEVWLPV